MRSSAVGSLLVRDLAPVLLHRNLLHGCQIKREGAAGAGLQAQLGSPCGNGGSSQVTLQPRYWPDSCRQFLALSGRRDDGCVNLSQSPDCLAGHPTMDEVRAECTTSNKCHSMLPSICSGQWQCHRKTSCEQGKVGGFDEYARTIIYLHTAGCSDRAPIEVGIAEILERNPLLPSWCRRLDIGDAASNAPVGQSNRSNDVAGEGGDERTVGQKVLPFPIQNTRSVCSR